METGHAGQDIQKCDQDNDYHHENAGGNANDNSYQTHNLRMRTRIGRYPAAVRGEKVRHKRQTMKSMTKPLKQWLYHHKDYPYPNRKEKLMLSRESTMTLVQVSNWFANARRRLKNTVHDPRMTWEQRIHKYNKHVTGNAERLSISSVESSGDELDDDEFDGFESDDESSTVNYAQNLTSSSCGHQGIIASSGRYHDANNDVDDVTRRCLPAHHPQVSQTTPQNNHVGQSLPTHKFKQSIMQRYLNDSYNHAQKLQTGVSPVPFSLASSQPLMLENTLNPPTFAERTTGRQLGQEWSKFRVSGSVSSLEYERLSTSPGTTTSSSIGSYRQRHSSEDYSLSSSSDDWTSFLKDAKNTDFKNEEEEETYWQEIVAAVALTNMARSRQQGK